MSSIFWWPHAQNYIPYMKYHMQMDDIILPYIGYHNIPKQNTNIPTCNQGIRTLVPRTESRMDCSGTRLGSYKGCLRECHSASSEYPFGTKNAV